MVLPEFDLEHFLPYQLAVLSSRISREFSTLYRDRFGITVAEWRVIAHLNAAGTVSVREIHERVDMDKSKVSRAATRLESAGYISKAAHPLDGRLVALSLTDKGRGMIEELAPIADKFEAAVLERLGRDADAFRGGLDRLLALSGDSG
jgi:DNA-binding MarR family transcriptional regulator